MLKTQTSSSFEIKPTLFFTIVALQIGFGLLFYHFFKPVLIALFILFFFILILYNIELSFLLILAIIFLVPGHGHEIPPLNLGIELKFIWSALLVVIIFLLIEIITKQRRYQPTHLKIPMLFFCSYLVVTTLMGILRGCETELIRRDFLTLSLFSLYFFIPSLMQGKKTFRYFMNILIFITAIVALQYLIIFILNLTGGTFIRIKPNQGLVFIFTIPLIFSYLLIMKVSLIKRLLLITTLILALSGIAITLTRGLWIALTIGIIIVLFLFHKEVNWRRVSIVGTVIIAGFIITMLIVVKIIGIDLWTFITARASTLLALSQIVSIKQRVLANQLVLEQFKHMPIFGSGLGSQISYSFMGGIFKVRWIDNSYLMLLWKLGVVGTLPFFILIAFALIQAVRAFKSSSTGIMKAFSGTMISFLISWIILGIASPLMIKYLLNVIWITLIAVIINRNNIAYEYSDNHA